MTNRTRGYSRPKAARRWRRNPFALFLICSVALSADRIAFGQETSVNVQTVLPEVAAEERTLNLVGVVDPWERAIIYSKVAGYLEWIGVDVGSWVKRGEVLARVDDPETRHDLERVTAERNTRESVYNRLKSAKDQNPDMVSQIDLDRAHGEYEASKAAANRLQELVSFAQVRAPYSGVISDRWVDPGALIQTGTSSQSPSARIVRIMRFDTVRVRVDIPESDSPMLREGQNASVKIAALHGDEFQGRIARYSWAIDPETRTMAAQIDVPNPDHRIRPGMQASATIYLSGARSVLLVPSEAIIVEGGKRYVWVIREGRAVRAPVLVATDNGVHAEIGQGLSESDETVVRGAERLSEGVAVVAARRATP